MRSAAQRSAPTGFRCARCGSPFEPQRVHWQVCARCEAERPPRSRRLPLRSIRAAAELVRRDLAIKREVPPRPAIARLGDALSCQGFEPADQLEIAFACSAWPEMSRDLRHSIELERAA